MLHVCVYGVHEYSIVGMCYTMLVRYVVCMSIVCVCMLWGACVDGI